MSMKMTIKDVPDTKTLKFPKRVNIAVSARAFDRLEELRKNKKDVAEFARIAIDRALDEVFEDKKIG